MKKLLVFLTVACMSTMVFAQTRNVKSADRALKRDKLDQALESIKLAMEESENQNIPEAWFSQAKIYTAIAATTKPEFKNLEANATKLAFESFQKAFSLDQVGKIKVVSGPIEVRKLIEVCYNTGVALYDAKDFAKAALSFEEAVNACKLIELSNTDELFVGSMLNTARCANYASNREMAKKYFLELIAMKTDKSDVYIDLANIFIAEKNNAEAQKYADMAITQFADSYETSINASLIHLNTQNSDRAKEILNQMTTKYPNESLVFMALGAAYAGINMLTEAENAYLKAIELKPGYYDAIIRLAVLYTGNADKIRNEANGLPMEESVKYEQLTIQSDELYKKALPLLEQALELKPGEIGVMDALRSIFVQLKMMDKANAIKAEIDKLAPATE